MAFGEAFDFDSEPSLFVKLGPRRLAIHRRERNPRQWWFRTYKQDQERVIRIGNVRIIYARHGGADKEVGDQNI